MLDGRRTLRLLLMLHAHGSDQREAASCYSTIAQRRCRRVCVPEGSPRRSVASIAAIVRAASIIAVIGRSIAAIIRRRIATPAAVINRSVSVVRSSAVVPVRSIEGARRCARCECADGKASETGCKSLSLGRRRYDQTAADRRHGRNHDQLLLHAAILSPKHRPVHNAFHSALVARRARL